MADPDPFRDLMARVRAGDQQAAADLVRALEPELRRAVRVCLSDPRLRRTMDSVDVCQSVLANFFVRARLGEFDLAEPAQLVGLLQAMARNKLADRARRQQAQKRDVRRVQGPADGDLDALAGGAVLDAGDRTKPAEQYAVGAVRLLGCAEAAGYFGRASNREALRQDADLAVLRERADFKRLAGRVLR